MNLQTKIPLRPLDTQIDYESEILLLGSCFAENVGEKFDYFKFKTTVNPFGIMFHPKAIENFLWMVTQKEEYLASDLFYNNEQWHCFDAHSSMSNSSQDTLVSNLNNTLICTRNVIGSATHIIITLGTSWVYRLQSLDMVVANCHKVPQKEFDKVLLPIDEINHCLQNCLQMIQLINPSAHVIFTVSPVRHTKDGFIENTVSKSHLIASVHHVLNSVKNTSYFPSYEIMMDELRDYRYYSDDMVHPSSLAIQYIWNCFSRISFSEKTMHIMNRINDIRKGYSHKPFHPKSKQHLLFLEQLENKKNQLQNEYPFIRF